ncbi:protein kinase domain-containing protein [Hyalangium minutum]|nr:protein kinase [Hyalangium minutum]
MEENSPPAPPPPPGKDTPTLTVSGSNAEGTAQDLQVANRERYLLYGVVAEGGQGRIIRAKDLQLERIVALKELRKSGGELETRFVREARITARLQHPAIVPVYEAGRWPSGEPFYAMKLVAGRSLARFIESLHTLAERLAALPHVLTVAEAIAYAHSQRIIHRDLKPANVLVGEFGETVVVDWGLCKELDRIEPSHPESSTGSSLPLGSEYTQEGTVMGTPAYLPPEQAAGKAVDERADVYALGAMLYQVLSGQSPYQGKSVQEVLQKVLKEEPTPLAHLQPQVPEELLTIVSRAMKREPEHRYPSAREFAEDLRRFTSGQLVGSHQYSVWQRMRRFARQYQAPLRVAVVALAALVAGAVFDYQRVRHERDRAEEKQVAAEEAERKATQRADELTIIEARNSLAHSPERVLKLLDSLAPSFAQWGQVRTLAADAVSLGMATQLKGHTQSIRALRFSPDGRWLLTTNDDRTARLWDIQAGTSRVVATHDSQAGIGVFSPDGKYIATSSRYGPIKLREIDTGASRDLTGHTLGVTGLAFLPNGRGLISAALDGQIRWWDVASGVSRLVGSHLGGIRQFHLLPGGEQGVSVGKEDNVAKLWELKEGSSQQLCEGVQRVRAVGVASQVGSLAIGIRQGEIFLWDHVDGRKHTLKTGQDWLHSIALSPDGRWLAYGSRDCNGGGIKLHDLETGASRDIISTRDWDPAQTPLALFSPDGQWLVIGEAQTGSARLLLFELATGTSRLLSKTSEFIFSAAFSPNGEWLAVAERVNVRLYRLKESDPFPRIIVRHDRTSMPTAPKSREFTKNSELNERLLGTVTTLAWTQGGSHLLDTWNNGNKVRLSNVRGDSIVETSAHEGGMTAAYALSDGSRLVTAGVDGTVALWNESGQLLQRFRSSDQPIGVLALSAGGTRIAGGDASGGVWLWDVSSGKSRVLGRHEERVFTLSFSPDGHYLASGSADGELRLWELTNGVGRTVHRHRGELSASAFSPDSHFLAAGGSEGTWLQPLDGKEGELLESLSTGTLLFSADGKQLFTGGPFSVLMRWDVETRKHLGYLTEGFDPIFDMALSPDGQRLATGDVDGSIHLWDLQSGKARVLLGHEGDVTRVAFSPDGRYLVSTGIDGTVRLWKDDLPLGAEEIRAWVHEAAQKWPE